MTGRPGKSPATSLGSWLDRSALPRFSVSQSGCHNVDVAKRIIFLAWYLMVHLCACPNAGDSFDDYREDQSI
jgi:hypothetical protein